MSFLIFQQLAFSFIIQTTPRSEELFESLSETVNASLGLPSKSSTIELAKAPLGYSQQDQEEEENVVKTTEKTSTIPQEIQAVLQQQTQLIQAQQNELTEIKGLLKMVLQQQQQQQHSSFPPPPSIPHETNTNSTAAASVDNDSVEDIKVHMQLLQKSAASQFSKANKDFSKQCSILFIFFFFFFGRYEQATLSVSFCFLVSLCQNNNSLELQYIGHYDMKNINNKACNSSTYNFKEIFCK